MAETFDLLLRGGTLVTHNGIDLGDIGVRDGRTVAIGDLTTASADETVDATTPATAFATSLAIASPAGAS